MMKHAMTQRNQGLIRARLQMTFPTAAGIDIGRATSYVAIPRERDDELHQLMSFGLRCAECAIA